MKRLLIPMGSGKNANPCWINFHNSVRKTDNNIIIDWRKELNRWGAKFVSTTDSVGYLDAIEFETEEQMSLFILRWS